MSALTDPVGGMLNVLVDVSRAMSPLEVREFLITGTLPNLSQPPPEDASSETQTELSDTEARLWLSTLTASDHRIPECLVDDVDRDDVVYPDNTEQISQTSVKLVTLSSL